MVNLILIRDNGVKETKGLYLIMDGITELFRCFCLELPWLNNKVNVSCISDGTYPVVKYSYAGHPNVFWIKNVPGRSGIMIHIGNFVTGPKIDSEGCQIPGLDFVDINGDGNLDIVAPDIALAAMNHFLPNSFTLTIISFNNTTNGKNSKNRKKVRVEKRSTRLQG
jgi:hypothetical protein